MECSYACLCPCIFLLGPFLQCNYDGYPYVSVLDGGSPFTCTFMPYGFGATLPDTIHGNRKAAVQTPRRIKVRRKLPAQALLPSFIPSSTSTVGMRDTRRQVSEGNRYTASSSTCLASKASTCDIRQPQTVPVSNPSAFPFSFSYLTPHQSSSPNHPATKKHPWPFGSPAETPAIQ